MTTFIKHLALILVAYFLSSLLTGYVVTFSLLGSSDYMGDEARKGVLSFGVFISFMVAYFAACPAAITVAIGEYFSIRQWWYYAAAGGVIGLALGTMFKPPEFFPWLGLGFGPVAGVVFWILAGRRAGLEDHRSRLITAGIFAASALLLFVVAWTAFLGIRF